MREGEHNLYFCSTHSGRHPANYMVKLNYVQLSDIVIGSIIITLTCKFSFMCLLILLNNFLLMTYLSFVGIFFKGHHTFITHLSIFRDTYYHFSPLEL